jgi:PAS domain-containing protein
VLTVRGADHSYRVLVEIINDGAATLDGAGTILYANTRFAAILRIPARNFIGTSSHDYICAFHREMLRNCGTDVRANTKLKCTNCPRQGHRKNFDFAG